MSVLWTGDGGEAEYCGECAEERESIKRRGVTVSQRFIGNWFIKKYHMDECAERLYFTKTGDGSRTVGNFF